jgi:uncharacterized membrane protein YdbT with pleckstrin-like domain
MNSKVEKKIEKEVGKKVAKEIQREVDKEVDVRVKEEVKEVEKAVRKEVEKRLHIKLYQGARDSALMFKEEFRKQVIVAISAALGFLIALSWRTPIQNSVSLLIEKMGLSGSAVFFEYLSALVITLIAVLVLMFISRWNVGKG